jgi:hypothetical protein
MDKRVFTAKEIATLLTSQAGSDIELNLSEGLKVIRMASRERPVFMIERAGKPTHSLDEADAAELAEFSTIVWAFAGEFLPSGDAADELTPDALKDKPDDDPLTPDALREKPEPENLAPDPTGLTPERLRDIIADPGLARRLATGTATKDETLTPENLKSE